MELVRTGRVTQTGDREADLRQALQILRHTHLPKLETAGLITRETDSETVTITDHPAFEDEGIIAAIESESDGATDSLDELFRAVGDARRRTILLVLSQRQGPVQTETLARTVGAKEAGIPESEVPTADLDRIRVDLVHAHLPALADSGLVTYDSDEQTVVYEGHPQLTVPWMHSLLAPEFRRRLTGNP
jgi:DNA-binding transcriptional ArsR family regulator